MADIRLKGINLFADPSLCPDPRRGAGGLGGRARRRRRPGDGDRQAQAGPFHAGRDPAAPVGRDRPDAGHRRRRSESAQGQHPAQRRGQGQRSRPLSLCRRQRRRYVGRRLAHRARPAAAARHAGDPQRHDGAQRGRPGQGLRAQHRVEHLSRPSAAGPAGTGRRRRRVDRDRRPRPAAADDGFRKAHHQGRGRAHAGPLDARRNRGDGAAQPRPADPDPGSRRRHFAGRGDRHRVRNQHRQFGVARQATAQEPRQVLDWPRQPESPALPSISRWR